MELRRRRFRTAAGWCFARAKPPSSRPSAARAGTHNHRRLSWVRFRGDDPRLWSHFAITTASLVPAARFAPGVCNFASLTPKRGVGGAPRNVRVLSGTPVGHAMTRHARRLARRLAPRNAGRSPLGAPPWRFFTRGRASVSGITRIRAASSSQPGRSAWRAGSRASRDERLRAAAAGRHASLRLQDRL
jgi:hypothetical protein